MQATDLTHYDWAYWRFIESVVQQIVAPIKEQHEKQMWFNLLLAAEAGEI